MKRKEDYLFLANVAADVVFISVFLYRMGNSQSQDLPAELLATWADKKDPDLEVLLPEIVEESLTERQRKFIVSTLYKLPLSKTLSAKEVRHYMKHLSVYQVGMPYQYKHSKGAVQGWEWAGGCCPESRPPPHANRRPSLDLKCMYIGSPLYDHLLPPPPPKKTPPHSPPPHPTPLTRPWLSDVTSHEEDACYLYKCGVLSRMHILPAFP